MAMSNWDTFAMNEKGESTGGTFRSPLGVEVSLYKNWIYVRDKKAWVDGGHYIKPTIMEIKQGDIIYKDVEILALRGPQNGIYCVVWCTKYYKQRSKTTYKEPKITGMIGCGVSGYGETDDKGDCEYVGVLQSSLKWFKKEMSRKERTYWETYSYDPDTMEDTYKKEMHYCEKYNIPDVFKNMDLSNGSRFCQGDAVFTKNVGTDLQATKPGEAKTPVIMKLMGK